MKGWKKVPTEETLLRYKRRRETIERYVGISNIKLDEFGRLIE